MTNSFPVASRTPNSTYIPKYAVGKFDRTTIDGVHFTTDNVIDEGITLVDPEGRRQFFSYEWFYILNCQGKVEIKRDFHTKEVGGREDKPDIADLADEKVQKALYVAEILNEFLRVEQVGKKHPILANTDFKQRRFSRGPACLKHVQPLIKAKVDREFAGRRGGKVYTSWTVVTPRHFRRLLERYELGAYDPLSLVSRAAGPKTRATSFHQEDLVLWLEYATKYADAKKPSMRACFLDLQAKVHELNGVRLDERKRLHHMPSRKTFEKLIKGLDQFWVCVKRDSVEVAKKKFIIVHQGVDVERPGERVEIDEWKIDLFTQLSYLKVWELLSPEEQAAIKRTRLWVTVAIDVATRCILAMRFSAKAPSHESSVAALEMIVSDKNLIAQMSGAQSSWIYHLRPERIYTDAGAAFTSSIFRRAVASLKITHMFPPAGVPSARGTIESFFKTCSQQFLSWFHGRTHSSIVERGRYDAKGNAVLNVDELNRFLVRAIVDIYHRRGHESLHGESPHNAWLRLSRENPMMPPPSPAQRRRWLGTEVKRTIRDKGVRFLGIHYQSEAIQRLRAVSGEIQVRIRIDRFDLKTISVMIGEKWHSVDAEIGLPVGISVWEWVGAAKELKAIHAANTNESLSIVLDAVNALRDGGDAAAARAELGTDVPDQARYNKLEKELFHSFNFIDDMVGKDPRLAPLLLPRDPLHAGIDAFREFPGEVPADYPEPAPAPSVSGFSSSRGKELFKDVDVDVDVEDDDGLDFDYQA